MAETLPQTEPRDQATIECRVVSDDEERRTCLEIRHEVFVDEQGIFSGTDRDERDVDPATRLIAGFVDDQIAGTVRIYPLDEHRLWKGDRLAVRSGLRRSGITLGQKLVRCAVQTAGELGGREMVAQIQLPNVPFFERLGWQRAGDPAPYQGVPHQKMRIDL